MSKQIVKSSILLLSLLALGVAFFVSRDNSQLGIGLGLFTYTVILTNAALTRARQTNTLPAIRRLLLKAAFVSLLTAALFASMSVNALTTFIAVAVSIFATILICHQLLTHKRVSQQGSS